jgi:hypothetical protein
MSYETVQFFVCLLTLLQLVILGFMSPWFVSVHDRMSVRQVAATVAVAFTVLVLWVVFMAVRSTRDSAAEDTAWKWAIEQAPRQVEAP